MHRPLCASQSKSFPDPHVLRRSRGSPPERAGWVIVVLHLHHSARTPVCHALHWCLCFAFGFASLAMMVSCSSLKTYPIAQLAWFLPLPEAALSLTAQVSSTVILGTKEPRRYRSPDPGRIRTEPYFPPWLVERYFQDPARHHSRNPVTRRQRKLTTRKPYRH